MSFLNPILLFGIGAVAVPIVIHLLNRRRFRRVVWGAMRFLRVSVERNRRRMRLEDLILLALRCLLLALLALGLARPALQSESNALFGQAKVTGVLILDASYSMGVSDGVATRFEKARNAAEEILDGLPAGSALAVWLAGEGYHGIVPEPTFDLNLARKSIREASLTDWGTDLFPSLRAAVETLRNRLGGRREVYLVTDGQAVGWRQLNEIADVLARAREEIGVHVIVVEDGQRQNLSLSDLRLAGGLAPVGEPVRFEARIQNHGDEEARDLRLSLSVDGQPAEDGVALDHLPAGSTRTISLFGKLPTPGYHAVTARVGADRLPADDQRTLAVRGVQEVRVLLVDGEPGNEPREQETFFLAHALTPVAPEQRAGYFIQTTRATTPELANARLDDYDAVVLANVPDLPGAMVAGLESYLRRGGGLIVFVGERVNTGFYNRQLFERNRILPAALGAAVGDATQETNFLTLASGNYDHPIAELWNDPAAGTLASARFYRRLTLAVAQDESPAQPHSPLSEVGSGGSPTSWSEPARVVARYADGTPAVMERGWGLGRVVLFGSTADTDWNDLAVRPAFVPLMHRVLGAILARQDAGLNVRVGERFVRRMASEYLDKDAQVRAPGAAENAGELRRVELIGGWPVLQYDQTDLAGLYQVELGDPPLQLRFAAQADPMESNLEPMTPAQADVLSGLADVTRWDSGVDLRDRLTRMRTGMELWWPLVVGVIGLALVESGLAQWFSRSK